MSSKQGVKLPILGSAAIPNTSEATVYRGRKYYWQDQYEFHYHIIFHVGINCLELIVYAPASRSEYRLYIHLVDCYGYIDKEILGSKNAYETLKLESQRTSQILGLPIDQITQISIVVSYIIHHLHVHREKSNFIAYISSDSEGHHELKEKFISLAFPAKSDSSVAQSSITIDRSNITSNSFGDVVPTTSGAHALWVANFEKLVSLSNKLLLETSSQPNKGAASASPQSPADTGQVAGGLGLVAMLNLKRRINNFKTSVSLRSPRTKQGLKALNTTFHKFKHDDELLAESLSFLHVSDMMCYHRVCKKWNQVLKGLVGRSNKLVITPRDKFAMEDISRPTSSSSSKVDDQATTTPSFSNALQRAEMKNTNKLETTYVTPDTIQRILAKGALDIEHLVLDKCILNLDIYKTLCKVLFGKLKKLSIGLVKVTPEVILSAKNAQIAAFKLESSENKEGETSSQGLSNASSEQSLRRPSAAGVTSLPYLNGIILKNFLGSCGFNITYLELSVSIKDLPTDTFSRTPKLRTLVPLHVNFADAIRQEKGALEGAVDMLAYVKALQDFTMPNLLQTMRDSTNEALALTDSRGNIVVANEGFEALTKYTAFEIYGKPFDILYGKLSDELVVRTIKESFKRQKKTADVNVILYAKNGMAFVCQAIVVPNISSHKGLLLNYNSLNLDYLCSIINEEAATADANSAKTVREWLASQKTLKYHLVRLGVLSEHFKPNKLAQRAKIKI